VILGGPQRSQCDLLELRGLDVRAQEDRHVRIIRVCDERRFIGQTEFTSA
jgi:hypothetical protein